MRVVSLQTSESYVQSPASAVLSREQLVLSSPEEVPDEADSQISIPVVSLDCDIISDTLAARLAISLIGHVLFLKSQIPLPIVQLSRLSTAKSSTRALKQRNELLSSFDTLSSHLYTTFTALSSAFAAMKRQGGDDAESVGSDRARAYMGVFVGSSATSAKAKVLFAVDGLEIKAIGAREDGPRKGNRDREDPHVGKENDEEEEEEAHDDNGDGESEGEIDEGDDQEDEEEEGDEDEDEGQEDSASDDYDDDDDDSLPPESRTPSPEPPSPSQTHAEQQRALQVAERSFSRTLAAADARGSGMSADIAPTQTHILLRAPRRFNHPAWLPRQNYSANLENTLDEFLADTGFSSSLNKTSNSSNGGIRATTATTKNKKALTKTKKGKCEGVWLATRNGLDRNANANTNTFKDLVKGNDGDEWDEMIWWSWDGKIVGFSDW